METIKAYTDISQSKKLAEILPLESADMWYSIVDDEPFVCLEHHNEYEQIPCWSLAALLKTLNFPSLTQNKEDEWEVCVFDHDNDDYIEKTASNPVDACVEMIMTVERKN